MSEGHIRGFRTNRADLPGVSELMIYPPPHLCSPTITVAHAPKLLIADERIYNTLRYAVLQGDSRQRNKAPGRVADDTQGRDTDREAYGRHDVAQDVSHAVPRWMREHP